MSFAKSNVRRSVRHCAMSLAWAFKLLFGASQGVVLVDTGQSWAGQRSLASLVSRAKVASLAQRLMSKTALEMMWVTVG